MYEVRCFGPPALTLDGKPVTFARKKDLALLVYLAVSGCPHTRATLATLLWPGHDERHAFGYLRTALCEINAARAGALIVADRQSLRIAPSGVDVDVTRFRRLCGGSVAGIAGHADCARLTEAVDIRRETFLRGFTLKDAPGFDDWQRETAEELDRTCRDALAALVGACVCDGDLPAAIARARQLVALDELDEVNHRLLMRVLALAGRTTEVEVHFGRCARLLERELGAPPANETRRLRERVRAARSAGEEDALARELRGELLAVFRGPQSRACRPAIHEEHPPAARPPLVLSKPTGVCLDAESRIYIADSGNHRIVRVDDLEGSGAVVFGSYGSGPGQFLNPVSVWVDPAGRIHVVDTRANRVSRFDDMSGIGWISCGSRGAAPGQFTAPSGVCGDQRGRILVSDTGNNRLVRVDDMRGAGWVSLGGPSPGSGPQGFSLPRGVWVDGSGWIYVSNEGSGTIVRIDDLDGTGWSVLRRPARSSRTMVPWGVCTDSKGFLYVACCHGWSIVRYAGMSGLDWTELHGRPGGGASIIDTFSYPYGICLDAEGRIYIADSSNNRIVRVDDIFGAGWTVFPRPARAVG